MTTAGTVVETDSRAARTTSRRPTKLHRGPDRITVALLSLAAFLIVLALLAGQLRAAAGGHGPSARLVVIRRIYRTRIVETIRNGSGANSISQSLSSSGSPVLAPVAVTTHTS